ncbi:hypothetical protein SteCoe_34328 [Stentor coeruleus]|uniref:Uncharacterized protein n=1 Tax=Stentor coeruleus TaxID=5963 RepID=A0A1R2AUZ2_9CILI|nr:hypothetical protein SteCoe_34328 [Stentor coeruleus]
MGANNAHGGMAVQLENSSYQTGAEVVGMIHISLTASISPSTLYLCFVGKEKTKWVEARTVSHTGPDGKIQHTTEYDHHSGKHYVCKYSFPIMKWDGGINQGNYSMPFSFRLPDNVPGSFNYEKDSNLASISYKIRMKLVGTSNELVKGKTLIHIRQNFDERFNQEISQNINAKLKTWCCVDQGTCKINVSYPQNSYNPSQIVQCHAQIDNSQSKLVVAGVVCNLFYSIRLKDHNGKTHFVKESILKNTVPIKIASGTSLLNTSAVEIKQDLPSIAHLLQSRYTTKGHLIECIYTNEVKADMDGVCMCCGDTPSINSYVNIVPNFVMPQMYMPPAPANWNPQMLQPIALQYDPRYEVQR